MRCANPQCSTEVLYLRDGSLQLLQYEPDSDYTLDGEEGAFPMRSLPCRFFWLCEACTRLYVMKQWTARGLVLSLRAPASVISVSSKPMKLRNVQAA